MIKEIIKKSNINIIGMIRNGTVAVVTMFSVGILFGSENIMIAFPIALTSTVIGRNNFYVKPFTRIRKILIVDLIIVLVAFISSLNIWIGIIIDFVSIFLIIYNMSETFDLTFYKPFIMLYVFTQYAKISFDELPNRLLAVVFGSVVIAIATYIKRVNSKVILGNSVESALDLIDIQFSNILSNKFDNNISKKCTKIMMDLVYKVYISRYKNYLTTNIGTIQFKMYLTIEYLNLYLKKINYKYVNNIISEEMVYEFKNIIHTISNYCKKGGDLQVDVNKYENKFEDYYVVSIITNLIENIKKMEKLDNRQINRIYTEWEKADLDKKKMFYKEQYKVNSILFKFAMRMAITLSLSIFIAEFLGFYKVIWAIVTIMSIMQPYYEDTIKNVKARIMGNIIAIIFVGSVIYLINSRVVTIIILIISLYLLYGFKEYYKISLFAAIASISISSLSVNLNEILFYRILYLIVGVVIVLLANQFIFPYKLTDGINELVKKIIKYDDYLIRCSKEYITNEEQVHKIRDTIIHITLLTQKLVLRNQQYGSDKINRFIDNNNEFVVNIGYKILISYEGSSIEQKIEESIGIYDEIRKNIK